MGWAPGLLLWVQRAEAGEDGAAFSPVACPLPRITNLIASGLL